jgi:hypothetical protein
MANSEVLGLFAWHMYISVGIDTKSFHSLTIGRAISYVCLCISFLGSGILLHPKNKIRR